MSLSRFTSFDTDSAPEASYALVAGSLKRFGFVPSPVAKSALSPTLLKHLFAGFAAFESSSLSPLEQEVLALSIAFENECHYCMAMHSARLASSDDNAGLLASLREGRPLTDTKLEALRSFMLAVVRTKGNVGDNEWVAFGAAGYSNEQALDVLLGVGVYMLSTLTNVLTGAPVDPQFSAYAWEKPASLSHIVRIVRAPAREVSLLFGRRVIVWIYLRDAISVPSKDLEPRFATPQRRVGRSPSRHFSLRATKHRTAWTSSFLQPRFSSRRTQPMPPIVVST